MTRSEESKVERILSVVFYGDRGLCVELGDENVDKTVYGYGPTQDFIRAVAKEIMFQIRKIGDLGENPTLRRVNRRFRQGLEKRREVSDESPTSKIAWRSLPEDPYVALKKVRKILGVNEDQLDSLMALLAKADDGYLHFEVGNVWIEFFNYSIDEKEIVLHVSVENKDITKSVHYRLKTQPKDVKVAKSV